MDQIAGTHRHPGDANFPTEAGDMHIGMRRSDRPSQRLESRRPLRDIADRAIGDHAKTSERLVDGAVDLTPERAESGFATVDVLNDADARTGTGPDILIVRQPLCLLLGCR